MINFDRKDILPILYLFLFILAEFYFDKQENNKIFIKPKSIQYYKIQCWIIKYVFCRIVYYKSLSDSNWCKKDYNWTCFE